MQAKSPIAMLLAGHRSSEPGSLGAAETIPLKWDVILARRRTIVGVAL